MLLGHIDFKDFFVVLNDKTFPTLAAAKTAGAPVIAYGQFLNTVVSFVIVAFAIFLTVRLANKLHGPVPAPPAPSTKDCPFCCSAIPIPATRCPHCTSQL
jgi:large conductance mechanosensitive channel